jgi:sodium transport system permease protein
MRIATRLELIASVLRKDLLGVARDRRTLLTILLLPLLFAPLCMMIMPIAIGAITSKASLPRHTLAVEANVPESLREQFKLPLMRLQFREVTDVERAVREGKANIGLRLRAPLPQSLDAPTAQLEVFSNQLDLRGRSTLMMIESSVNRHNEALLQEKLRALAINVSNKPLQLKHTALSSGQAFGFISLLLPLLVIIWGMAGIQATVLDTVFGERDRHTLEPLLVSPIERSDVLLAKLLSITLFGALAAVCGILGFALTIFLAQMSATQFLGAGAVQLIQKIMSEFVGPYLGSKMGLADIALLLLNVCSLLTALAAIILLPCIFARTQHEAQMYCGFGVLIGVAFMAPAGINEALPLGSLLYALPVSGNAACVAECLRGDGNLMRTLGAMLSSLLFAALLLWVALWFFRKERVIFRT